jgi:hypothetical protein
MSFQEKGGTGVKDLRKQIINLLWKWWWKPVTQRDLAGYCHSEILDEQNYSHCHSKV